jgi:outer membrane protein TolC
LRAKLKEAELNRKLYSLSKLDLIPDFGFQIERRTVPGMWMGKIMISVPIFFPYKEVKKIKAAKHKVEATEKEIFNLKNIIAAELRDAIVTIKSAEKQLEIYRKRSIPKVLEALRSAESGYSAGITDFLVLIDTEKQYLKLEMMYWKARSDLGKGLTKLEKILAIRNLSALKEIKR